ncbi:MAG: glycyl-radical enzyme activating protein [Erysipelotrichaceae bacterium]|nr:glycyl-radical enzyme activating protein [Erysipelotrichaceae bacterium]
MGIVFDIKRYAIHDGDGIRTTIFLKGCPLRCKWCHNPEGLDASLQLGYISNTCMGCMRCINRCKKQCLSMENGTIHISEDCDACGECIDFCPTNSLKIIGQNMSLEQLRKEIEKDCIFYETTGGGVTFSGGEVFMQPEYLESALQMCKEMGVHTTIESSFMTSFSHIEKVIGLVDQFIVDIKLMDNELHKEFTGVNNTLILENISKLMKYDVALLIRTPLIPNITATKDNLVRIGEFIRSLEHKVEIELLNYNPLAESKYPMIQQEYTLMGLKPFTDEEVQLFYSYVRRE